MIEFDEMKPTNARTGLKNMLRLEILKILRSVPPSVYVLGKWRAGAITVPPTNGASESGRPISRQASTRKRRKRLQRRERERVTA